MAKEMRCPNCAAKVAVGKEGKAVCAECGGSFIWEDGKARLAGVEEFDQVKKQVGTLGESVEQIKQHLGIGQADKPADPADDDEDI